MKVLLDHNLPHKLRNELAASCPNEFVTASFLGWGHLKNGELLRAAEAEGFDVLLTGDRTLVYEQNLGVRQLAVLALSANNWPIVRECISKICDALSRLEAGQFETVDCGTFSRQQDLPLS